MNSSLAQSEAQPTRDTDALDGWLTSLETMYRIPEEFRSEVLDRQGALEILGCDAPVLDELVKRGLPCSGSAGEERFDRFEIVNLALYSGTGISVAEQSIRYATRWMAEPPDSWSAEKRWDFSVEVGCASGESCSGDGTSRLAVPKPEVFGGRLESIQVLPEQELEEDADAMSTSMGTVSVTASLVTAGWRRGLSSSVLRDILSEYSGGDWRWTRLPEALQHRPDLVLPSGYAPCITVCLDLAAKCRAAGFEARTRRGWLMGMLDLAHSWLEVIDEDGMVKVVDPAFMLIAQDHAESVHPEFMEACMGSAFNRVLPTAHAADQPLFGHSCTAAGSSFATRTIIRLSD